MTSEGEEFPEYEAELRSPSTPIPRRRGRPRDESRHSVGSSVISSGEEDSSDGSDYEISLRPQRKRQKTILLPLLPQFLPLPPKRKAFRATKLAAMK